jgi:hypothetical protein
MLLQAHSADVLVVYAVQTSSCRAGLTPGAYSETATLLLLLCCPLQAHDLQQQLVSVSAELEAAREVLQQRDKEVDRLNRSASASASSSKQQGLQQQQLQHVQHRASWQEHPYAAHHAYQCSTSDQQQLLHTLAEVGCLANRQQQLLSMLVCNAVCHRNTCPVLCYNPAGR